MDNTNKLAKKNSNVGTDALKMMINDERTQKKLLRKC